MKFPRAYYSAIATLTGCIIGAGIFGIPYVVVRAGFWTGMLVMVCLGAATLLVHLLAGEVSLRSNKCHQLVGYAEKYLGKKGKYLMAASMVIGVYGAMIAYTIGVSESLSILFGGSQAFWAVVFYAAMGWLLHGGIKMLEESEMWMEGVKFIAFFIILALLFFSPHFSSGKFIGFSWQALLVPYGVILFAYMGTAAIPEVREAMNKCRLLTKRAIIIGTIIPMLVYFLFTLAVIGVTGGSTTELATIGLAPFISNFGFMLLQVFAVLAMASSFVALGYALKESYCMDFKLPHGEAWLLTLVIPVALMLIGITSFIEALQVTGAFAGGIAGIVIVLMHAKAKKRSERQPEYKIKLNWIGYGLLIVLFTVGMLYELLLFV